MKAKGYIYGIALSVLILVLMAANLWFGSINIPAGAVWNTLTGNEVEKASWTFIIWAKIVRNWHALPDAPITRTSPVRPPSILAFTHREFRGIR